MEALRETIFNDTLDLIGIPAVISNTSGVICREVQL